MQKGWRIVLFAIVVVCCAQDVWAQYYSWGADSPQKWSRMEGDRVQVVYPDTASAISRRVLHYINAVQGDISHGFTHPALDIPFVIHPENFSSNGLVMWCPKRIEFISTPSTGGYSMLWSKQLVAHEYRHAVQYNNLNRHWIRGFSYVLGQQGSMIGLAFLPLFVIEGDAVLIETQMSTYGRGLQPSFTMEYRAMGDDMLSRKNIDKWFCGSYRENIPDHYHIGYQIISYAYQKYNTNVWDKSVWYSTRNPYMVFSSSAGLKRFYDTSIRKLSTEAFAELNDLWRPLREIPNSTQTISHIDSTDYTTYSHPMPLDSGQVLSLKSSYRHTPRFVIFEGENESLLEKVGSVSSRPSYGDGRVWWTEYRRSLLFEQKVNSQLCYMDIERGRAKSVKGVSSALFAEPTTNGRIAYVEYSPSGKYTVIERDAESEIRRLSVELPTEIHGLAWDDTTQKLYVIAIDYDGMWLGEEHEGGFCPLHKGRYITLSNLRAQGGVLYFGSIASGLDELHSYDLATGVERQITRSTYGSFDPSEPKDGYIYATTYDRYGYHLARQSADSVVGKITAGHIPNNMVNPERRSLGLINLDEVRFDHADSVELTEKSPAKRYHKGSHLVNPHSWAPVRFNPFEILEEQTVDIGFGATLLSQNLLSSAEGYLSYGYDKHEGSVISSSLTYNGLGVELSGGVTYGGVRQEYRHFSDAPAPTYSNENYFSVSALASLPLYFQRGKLSHQLNIWSGYNFSNGLALDLTTLDGSYNRGVHKLSFGTGFGTYARSSYRDFEVPLGFYVAGSYSLNPTNRDFCDLLSSYAKLYLPGVLPHNSLTIAANYQNSFGEGHSYRSAYIIPSGYYVEDILNKNYIATSVNYELPVWYPDGGLCSVIYFSRVRLKAGAQYAQFDYYGTRRLYSYGGGVVLDINPLRLPASGGMEIELEVYKPNRSGLSYEWGLSIPF